MAGHIRLVVVLALVACLSCVDAGGRSGSGEARQRLQVRRHLKRLNKTPVRSITRKPPSIAQLWHQNGRCPEDTIPIRRTSRDDVLRVSSVKRYGRKKHRSTPNPLSVDPDLLNESGHQLAKEEDGGYNGRGGVRPRRTQGKGVALVWVATEEEEGNGGGPTSERICGESVYTHILSLLLSSLTSTVSTMEAGPKLRLFAVAMMAVVMASSLVEKAAAAEAPAPSPTSGATTLASPAAVLASLSALLFGYFLG
ncbi:hypothetical protein BHM03_00013772 [Ensete ventricosum]|nr:hypothetical protein BHM03_00013772 [Ensete ventricosum]